MKRGRTRTLPLEVLQDALDLDEDDLPYEVRIHDEHLTLEVANTEERPPQAGVCGFRQDGYTLTVSYLPESNEMRLSHSGPSIKYEVSLDEFSDMLLRSKVVSDLQYERAKLYASREWDRHACEKCGVLLTDTEMDKLRIVARDHAIDSPLCKSHQEMLYDIMEYSPWEEEYDEDGDNRVEAEA